MIRSIRFAVFALVMIASVPAVASAQDRPTRQQMERQLGRLQLYRQRKATAEPSTHSSAPLAQWQEALSSEAEYDWPSAT